MFESYCLRKDLLGERLLARVWIFTRQKWPFVLHHVAILLGLPIGIVSPRLVLKHETHRLYQCNLVPRLHARRNVFLSLLRSVISLKLPLCGFSARPSHWYCQGCLMTLWCVLSIVSCRSALVVVPDPNLPQVWTTVHCTSDIHAGWGLGDETKFVPRHWLWIVSFSGLIQLSMRGENLGTRLNCEQFIIEAPNTSVWAPYHPIECRLAPRTWWFLHWLFSD